MIDKTSKAFIRALEIFYGENETLIWFGKHNKRLGKSPSEILKEPEGEKIVLDLLNRIEFG